MNAGGAQFGSTSFTFLVRRIFAALVFGAQLCSARAGERGQCDGCAGEQRNRPADDKVLLNPMALLPVRIMPGFVGLETAEYCQT